MEKEYTTRYPTIELDQRDLTQALNSMLNCRRYLSSLGFQEKFKERGRKLADTNSIGGGY